MNRSIRVSGLMLALSIHLWLSAAAAAEPPIVSIEGVTPKATVFEVAKRDAPLVIRTNEEAAEYFGEEPLAKLHQQVSFEKQVVLVFAWRGSGQDRLSYAVAESFPEQIFFTLTPGRTKDLRPHVYVYALRSNVQWSVR